MLQVQFTHAQYTQPNNQHQQQIHHAKINNTKPSKSPNSVIANSPSDNMKSKIINYIRAGYPRREFSLRLPRQVIISSPQKLPPSRIKAYQSILLFSVRHLLRRLRRGIRNSALLSIGHGLHCSNLYPPLESQRWG